MLVYIVCLHAFAFFPYSLFGNFPNCLEDSLNMQNSGNNSIRRSFVSNPSQGYCTALLALILAIWPLMAFFFFIKQGFDPYEDLSQQEKAVSGGSFASFLVLSRTLCHYFITVFTIYLIALWVTIVLARSSSKNGDKVWIAKKVRSLPFGCLFFQEGLYFDCGICMLVFAAEEDLVGLVCEETHVFHPKCLAEYLQTKNVCNLCG